MLEGVNLFLCAMPSTLSVARHMLQFMGQVGHADGAPMDKRCDLPIAAAPQNMARIPPAGAGCKNGLPMTLGSASGASCSASWMHKASWHAGFGAKSHTMETSTYLSQFSHFETISSMSPVYGSVTCSAQSVMRNRGDPGCSCFLFRSRFPTKSPIGSVP